MKTRTLVVNIETHWDYLVPAETKFEENQRRMADIRLGEAAHDLQEEIKALIWSRARRTE